MLNLRLRVAWAFLLMFLGTNLGGFAGTFKATQRDIYLAECREQATI